jgi:hypothetical protein
MFDSLFGVCTICQRCSHLPRLFRPSGQRQRIQSGPNRSTRIWARLGVGTGLRATRASSSLLAHDTRATTTQGEARDYSVPPCLKYGVSNPRGASPSSTSPPSATNTSAVAILAHSPASVPTYAPRIATLATLSDMDASTLSSSESTRTTTLAAAALAATALGIAVLVSRPRVNPWRSWRWSRRWRVLDSVMQCHHSACRRSHLGPRCCILLMACDAEVFARSS